MDDFFFNEKEAECCFEGEVSPSDLEKLEVEEDMPEVPRADMLLRNGLKQQKLSVLVSIPKILAAANSKENLQLLLEAVKHVWKKNETENDAELLKSVFTCVQSLASVTADGKIITYPMTTLFEEFDMEMKAYVKEKQTAVFLLSEDQVTRQILPLVLEFVHDLQQKDHAESASQCIAATIPRLTGSVKKTQIIRIGIEKGDVSQGAGSRLICCLILGVLTASNLLSEQDIDGLFFQKMMALCQDTDAEVRKCMCMQLDTLARAVGQAKACSSLLPELLELLQDEEEQVKVMAFRTILSLYDFFPKKERAEAIMPVLAEIIESPPTYLIAPLASLFGRLAFKLFTLSDFTPDHTTTFQTCYNKLSRSDDPDIRLACAYNFPAAVKSFGAGQYSSQLDELLQAFTQDKAEPVRITIVSGLHEVAQLLGPQRAQRYIKAISLNLFKDESAAVQGQLIARLPDLMPHLCTAADDDQKTAYVDAILKAILHHHTIIGVGRWRDQHLVLGALGQFPAFCSPTQLFERVCPLLFELMNAGARPVQLEAARVLVAVNRDNKIAANRVNVLLRLRKEYALGKSYWQRTLYLDACDHASTCYSTHYFRLNYLDPAIDLLDDPVPNVRLKALAHLPRWKHALDVTVAADEKAIARIRGLLDTTSTDADRDVRLTLLEARDLWHTEPPPDAAAVAADKQKKQTEDATSLSADHEMYSSEAKWSEMLEYTLIVGKDGQVVRRARVKSIDIINKLRQHTKEMNPRSGATASGSSSLAMQRSGAAVMPRSSAAQEKGTTKLPSAASGGARPTNNNGSTLPTCINNSSALPLAATMSSITNKSSGGAGNLSARESKSSGGMGGTNITSSGTLKQIADAKATSRTASTKTPAASGSTSARSTKEKKEETTLTKIPNIPVPTRPQVAPPAKRAQSPAVTKSTTAAPGSARTASATTAASAKVAPLSKRSSDSTK
ncbi:Aste57867_23032 [Aphanomyces stellatus]|uniref:Aste57867_23032 protein n=1 Tax=Aphanomyces stellatus TaxID=120398 RepID=A0A485LRA7_9STRA|nr:hypothetical protein As57867_022961 [Aphanomyces stellatus]VFT99680.1 Aste57867_23032 [Aphanomyces stellatus]